MPWCAPEPVISSKVNLAPFKIRSVQTFGGVLHGPVAAFGETFFLQDATFYFPDRPLPNKRSLDGRRDLDVQMAECGVLRNLWWIHGPTDISVRTDGCLLFSA